MRSTRIVTRSSSDLTRYFRWGIPRGYGIRRYGVTSVSKLFLFGEVFGFILDVRSSDIHFR